MTKSTRVVSACVFFLLATNAVGFGSRQSAVAWGTVTRDEVVPSISQEGCSNLPTLTCKVSPTEGSTTEGMVMFSPIWEKVRGSSEDDTTFTCYTRIQAVVSNLAASSMFGFHIHTYGDLSYSNGTSTGGHFTNPAGDEIEHGLPDDATRHWGDLGNLEADTSGMAQYDRIDDVVRLGGIVGRAITIHAESDKGAKEQPTGAAGARIAYCVIGYANPDVEN